MRWITRGIHREEEGVTLIIVALSLIAIFGMIVLVVDVGGLLWKRRELVNGSDAAALAAAQTCSVPSTVDGSLPEVQADTAAAANVDGLDPTSVTNIVDGASTCRQSRGYVTVQYQQQQKLFFAPVLGAGSTGGVTTRATAAWGPLAGGKAVPIVLDSSMFQGPCDIPYNVKPPADCNFWYDNGPFGLGAAQWGFLSLNPGGWGVDPGARCDSAGGTKDITKYIKFDYPDELLLKDPGPTYVCSISGHRDTSWDRALTDRYNCDPSSSTPLYPGCPGNLLLMPVNDCTKQVDKDGNIISCGTGKPPDKYAIIGFATLKVIKLLAGNDPAAYGTPGTSAGGGICSKPLGTAGVGDPTLPGGFGGWDLAAFAQQNCGATKAADTVTGVTVGPPNKKDPPLVACTNPGVTPVGCDYYFNPTNKILSWWDSTSKNTKNQVTFTWGINAVAPTPGACGLHPSDPNALCLVTQWTGFTSKNGSVGSGRNFGTQGFVLCDFTYNSCPKNVKP